MQMLTELRFWRRRTLLDCCSPSELAVFRFAADLPRMMNPAGRRILLYTLTARSPYVLCGALPASGQLAKTHRAEQDGRPVSSGIH